MMKFHDFNFDHSSINSTQIPNRLLCIEMVNLILEEITNFFYYG